MDAPAPRLRPLSILLMPRRSLVWVMYQAWMGRVTLASLSRSALLSE
jgi:hypothetical protein